MGDAQVETENDKRSTGIKDRHMKSIRVNEDTSLSITLNNGSVLIVDAVDKAILESSWVYLGGPKKYAYVQSKSSLKKQILARMIMQTPKGMECDHINGNNLDNRRVNLRNCTASENHQNSRTYRASGNPYKGAYYHKNFNSPKKWCSYIRVNKISYFLGCFMTAEEAAEAYNAKARELCGQFARLNVIGQTKETVSVINLAGDTHHAQSTNI